MASNDEKFVPDFQNTQVCEEFAAITATISRLAVHYQEREPWKTEDAVHMLTKEHTTKAEGCDDKVAEGAGPCQGAASDHGPLRGPLLQTQLLKAVYKHKLQARVHMPHLICREGAVTEHPSAEPAVTGTAQTSLHPPPSPGFRLITWNIDGLDDEDDDEERTIAACRILNDYSPDIIFLQEVIRETYPIICAQLSNYKLIPASDCGYYTVVLLKESTVTYLSSKVEDFQESTMGRALQIVQCKCAGIDLRLMTSNLESLGRNTMERKHQFLRALYLMKTAPADETVLFGGDTNLRDKEVREVGVPDYIHDVWETCGSPFDAKYTWDITRNDNLDWSDSYKPRLRFDRLYLRHAKTIRKVKPQEFTLIGTERLESCERFPSSHWGIVCDFQVIPYRKEHPTKAEGCDDDKVAEGAGPCQGVASVPRSSAGATSSDTVLKGRELEGAVTKHLPAEPAVTGATRQTSHPPPSPGFRLITWNIDGLDEDDHEERTMAACRILNDHSPDIIFLQEVVQETYPIICTQLSNYKLLPATEFGYYTAILLKESTVTYLSSKVEGFRGSTMGRALQIVQCKCAGIDLRLMTSHLESMGNKAEERKRQFLRALYLMKTAPGEETVLFGGDTNLRDKEVVQVGVPDYIHDVWEMCGSPANAKYTWDLTRNDNLDFDGLHQPRLRFDRLYLRHAKTTPKVKPREFTLIGTERLESCERFPSDHWGILCDFQVTTA